MRHCPHCQRPIPDDSRRCPECGRSLPLDIPWYLIAALVLALLGLITTLIAKPLTRYTVASPSGTGRSTYPSRSIAAPTLPTPTQPDSYRSPDGTLIPYAAGTTTWQVLNPDLYTGDSECLSCKVSDLEYSDVPSHSVWTVSFPADTPAEISMGWCAANRDILYTNWNQMTYELQVDGNSIPNSYLKLEKDESDVNSPCWTWQGIIIGWEPGEHTVTWVHTIYNDLSDGWGDYVRGNYDVTFQVTVE